MATKAKTYDWGGISLIVNELLLATKPQQKGSSSTATISAAELQYLDTVTAGTGEASKALVLDSGGDFSLPGKRLTSANTVTVTTGATTTAVELGDEDCHVTNLTLVAFAMGTGGDNADLALGNKLFTWPASMDVVIEDITYSGVITYDASVTTVTDGEIGFGSVIASTAIDTLDTTFGDYGVNSATMGSADLDGAEDKSFILATPTIVLSGAASRDVFFNIAATWANVATAGAVTADGTVSVKWRKIA